MKTTYGSPQDSKEVIIADKYTLAKAMGDCEAVMKALLEESKCAKDAAAGDQMMEGEMMEGGDDMMEGDGMGPLEPKAAWDPYEGDDGSYGTFTDLPSMLLRI